MNKVWIASVSTTLCTGKPIVLISVFDSEGKALEYAKRWDPGYCVIGSRIINEPDEA